MVKIDHPDRTTDALLSRRALAEKATPGRWDVIENFEDQTQCSVRIISPKHHIVLRDAWITFTDALFIVRHSPEVVMADIDEILHLREKVERLEKEADWLALVLANAGCGVPLTEYIDQNVNGMSPPEPEHWREAARNAVEENQCKN